MALIPTPSTLFKVREDQTIYISAAGFEKLMARYEGENGGKDVMWTTDYNLELPIRIKKSGPGSETPSTLIEEFERVMTVYADSPALSQKVNGKWQTLNYRQYFDECFRFGKSLIATGHYLSAVNIIRFNAPQWNITFFGSIFARCLPVGIYTTNSESSCAYIAEHSECKVVVAENMDLAKKYISLLSQKKINYIVLYNETKPIADNHGGRLLSWNDFLNLGKDIDDKILHKRMTEVQPGNCCTLVYTSGTTGMPKGVMLSHDNYTWVKKIVDIRRPVSKTDGPERGVSYLPLSHVAAQLQDVTGAMMDAMHIYFAEPTALQGTLIKTLQEVRPTIFFSVPRVWEKISEKLKELANSNAGGPKAWIATWAKSVGAQGSLNELQDKPTSFQYKLAKMLVFNNIRKALGLDQAQFMIFGAAPLAADIRHYFLTLGFPLLNGYGMSECSGPETLTDKVFMYDSKEYMKEAGSALPGTELKIVPLNPNETEGEICYRGRHIFMGYYKNPDETMKTIDQDGFLHSGDLGRLDKNGILFITGRVKQLLITAAGENIPPLLIENEIKEALPMVSNVMLIGDNRRFLTALVTLKAEPDGKLMAAFMPDYEKIGTTAKTIAEAKSCPVIFKMLEEGVKKANDKAISRAQKVQTFAILGEDFSVENGLLTPTLKLKRKEVLKKYADIIENFYRDSKL